MFGSEKVTWNHHSKGVSRQTYSEKPKLSDFFDVLSVNIDEEGKEFISTIEGNLFFLDYYILLHVLQLKLRKVKNSCHESICNL